jgi:hypothetical protein
MKGKFLLFIFCILLKNILPQTILFPINPFRLANDDNEKNENTTEDDKPIVETKELKDEDGNNIRITKIHYHRTKNLSGNSEAITPIQIMRIFDNRVNSIFEDLIRQSMGIKMLLNGLSMVDEDENEDKEDKIFRNKTENEEKNIFEEFELEEDDDEEEKEDINKIENKNDTIKRGKNYNEKLEKKSSKKEKKEKELKDGKNIKKIGKFSVNMDNLKNKNKKNKKKLSKRELIFSRVCKYIFYSIILFTIYILVKKLLEVLEIIDPDNAVEIKIENDETSKLKKTTENKQN